MNINEKLKENQDILDAYEKSHGVPNIKPPGTEEELQEYISMERDVIEKLPPEKIWSISVRLSQYSFYLQRSINRSKSIITFANNEINKIVANEIGQYDKFTKHDIKVYQICKTNVAAMELIKIKLYAEQVVDRFSELSNGVKNLSYVLSMGYKNKIGERE
jgi:hypothetical protein